MHRKVIRCIFYSWILPRSARTQSVIPVYAPLRSAQTERPPDVLRPFSAEAFKERIRAAAGIYVFFGQRSGSFRPIPATLAGGGVPVNRLRGQAEERRNRGVIRNAPISGGTERAGLSGRDVSFRRPPRRRAHRLFDPAGAPFAGMGRKCRSAE